MQCHPQRRACGNASLTRVRLPGAESGGAAVREDDLVGAGARRVRLLRRLDHNGVVLVAKRQRLPAQAAPPTSRPAETLVGEPAPGLEPARRACSPGRLNPAHVNRYSAMESARNVIRASTTAPAAKRFTRSHGAVSRLAGASKRPLPPAEHHVASPATRAPHAAHVNRCGICPRVPLFPCAACRAYNGRSLCCDAPGSAWLDGDDRGAASAPPGASRVLAFGTATGAPTRLRP